MLGSVRCTLELRLSSEGALVADGFDFCIGSAGFEVFPLDPLGFKGEVGILRLLLLLLQDV